MLSESQLVSQKLLEFKLGIEEMRLRARIEELLENDDLDLLYELLGAEVDIDDVKGAMIRLNWIESRKDAVLQELFTCRNCGEWPECICY